MIMCLLYRVENTQPMSAAHFINSELYCRIIRVHQVKTGTIREKRFHASFIPKNHLGQVGSAHFLIDGSDLGHNPLLYVLKSSCLMRSLTLAYGVNKSTIMYSSCYISHNNNK